MYHSSLSTPHSFFHLFLTLLLSQSHTQPLSLSFITPLTCTLSLTVSLSHSFSPSLSSISLSQLLSLSFIIVLTRSLSLSLTHSLSLSLVVAFTHTCCLSFSLSLSRILVVCSLSPPCHCSFSHMHCLTYSHIAPLTPLLLVVSINIHDSPSYFLSDSF